MSTLDNDAVCPVKLQILNLMGLTSSCSPNSSIIIRSKKLDDPYQVYLNRVVRQTLAEKYLSALQHIQESPKFHPDETGNRKAVPFPGYSVVSPTWKDDAKNTEFYEQMQKCQTQLLQEIPGDWLVPLPPDSFHLTLADLIWDDAYRLAISTPDLEAKLRQQIADSFAQSRHLAKGQAIAWQVLGIMVSTRSIGVLLMPADEQSYEQLVELRRSIYQNPGLIALGVEQQYHFTAHITLAYFSKIPENLDRDRLSVLFTEFNHRLMDNPQKLLVERAELRKFENMTEYQREPDWPIFQF